ncbi:MAG: MTH1187 family thiamine-binding protein [Thermoplasmata archaeon]
MIVEFSVAPVGIGESMSEQVAKCLDIVDRSGLNYRLTPMGTIIEGEWDDVNDVIRRCHFAVLQEAPRVLTTIRIDDRKGAKAAIEDKVTSVERVLRRDLRK